MKVPLAHTRLPDSPSTEYLQTDATPPHTLDTCCPPSPPHDAVRIMLSSRDSNVLADPRRTSMLELKLQDVCLTTRRNIAADDKLRAIFDLFDVDHQGRLTPAGLQTFLAATMAHANVKLCGVELQDIVAQTFEATNNRESLSFPEFQALFGASLPEGGPPTNSMPRLTNAALLQHGLPKWRTGLVRYQTELQFLVLYTLVNLLAFWLKWRSFPLDVIAGYYAKLAKACAQLVLVNAMFVLLPMCRSVVAALRNIRLLWYIFPFDHHIVFHQLAGAVILVA
ncbi:hypothetical protein As57867_014238, partial [Aphanomyces stellatus]